MPNGRPDDRVRQLSSILGRLRRSGAGGLFHSDRDSRYACGNFGKTWAVHGFVPSMSRQGHCGDNAVAESFFATLKNEEVTGLHETQAAAHAAIAISIHSFYDPTRLHSVLGDLPSNDSAKKLKQAP
jgi:transposase InsO family protein